MYKIKQLPLDFCVKEVSDFQLDGSGDYSYYTLEKTNCDMFRAISVVARALRVDQKHINYAGIKDKAAVTCQTISILNGPKKDFDLDNIKLKYLGKGKERIVLGSLVANRFDIVVRNIEQDKGFGDFAPKYPVPNYFDEQRFGMNADNHLVGRHIIKKEFEAAAKLIPELQDALVDNPTNFVGALFRLPKKHLLIYIHAYQSYLWNRVVSNYISKFRHKSVETGIGELNFPVELVDDKKVPLYGFGTEFSDDEIEQIYQKVLTEEKVSERDFIIRQMPGLSLEGTDRDLFIDIKDFSAGDLLDDDLNENKKKIRLEFTLPKGAYATMVVKWVFSL